MDLLEIAQTRNQIHELAIMVISLRQELKANKATLEKVELALNKKKFKNNPEFLATKKSYMEAVNETQATINSTLELIDQLRYRMKPRAQLQITQKLF